MGSAEVPDPTGSRKSIQFPVLCHYKIIAEDDRQTERQIRETMLEFGVYQHVEAGRHSEKGKYLTYNVEVVVNSIEFMHKLDAKLKSIRGVKMVL